MLFCVRVQGWLLEKKNAEEKKQPQRIWFCFRKKKPQRFFSFAASGVRFCSALPVHWLCNTATAVVENKRKVYCEMQKRKTVTVRTDGKPAPKRGKTVRFAPTHGALVRFFPFTRKVLTWNWALLRQLSRLGAPTAILALSLVVLTVLQVLKSALRDASWPFRQRVCGPFVPVRLCRFATLSLRPSCLSCPVPQQRHPGETFCTAVSVPLSVVPFLLFLFSAEPCLRLLSVVLSCSSRREGGGEKKRKASVQKTKTRPITKSCFLVFFVF